MSRSKTVPGSETDILLIHEEAIPLLAVDMCEKRTGIEIPLENFKAHIESCRFCKAYISFRLEENKNHRS